MLARLGEVVRVATEGFEAYDYSMALEATEKFFWQFCDDYLELVKERAYAEGSGANSARAALRLALDVQLRLFAPFLPFVTEEVWSWWQTGSIHLSSWPKADELPTGGQAELLDDIASALIGIRGAKSQAKVSMKTEATAATFTGLADVLARLQLAEADLRAVGRIIPAIVWVEADAPLSVAVELKPAQED